jgi:hypothetical protein
MTLQEKVLEIAKGEIGNQEIPLGSNWGEHVQKYLHSVGIDFPASWCMAFVYWCYSEAAKDLALPHISLFRSGGVLNVWNHTPEDHRVLIPQAGDIFIQDHGGGLGHTGIIESIEDIYMHTIEGNTNVNGSREGVEVERKKRLLSKSKGFIKVTT